MGSRPGVWLEWWVRWRCGPQRREHTNGLACRHGGYDGYGASNGFGRDGERAEAEVKAVATVLGESGGELELLIDELLKRQLLCGCVRALSSFLSLPQNAAAAKSTEVVDTALAWGDWAVELSIPATPADGLAAVLELCARTFERLNDTQGSARVRARQAGAPPLGTSTSRTPSSFGDGPLPPTGPLAPSFKSAGGFQVPRCSVTMRALGGTTAWSCAVCCRKSAAWERSDALRELLREAWAEVGVCPLCASRGARLV